MTQDLVWYDYVSSDWRVVKNVTEIPETVAKRLISQRPEVQEHFCQYLKAGMTPYLAMLTILADGNK